MSRLVLSDRSFTYNQNKTTVRLTESISSHQTTASFKGQNSSRRYPAESPRKRPTPVTSRTQFFPRVDRPRSYLGAVPGPLHVEDEFSVEVRQQLEPPFRRNAEPQQQAVPTSGHGHVRRSQHRWRQSAEFTMNQRSPSRGPTRDLISQELFQFKDNFAALESHGG